MASPIRIATLPNAISFARAACGPLVLVLLLSSSSSAVLATVLAVMLFAGASDIVDGAVARSYEQTGGLGEIVDPVCDAVYHLSVFLAFLSYGWIPAWMVFLIYARELIVPYLKTFVRQFGADLRLRWGSGIKTAIYSVCQIAVIVWALRSDDPEALTGDTVIYLLMSIACASAVISTLDYIAAALRVRASQ